MSACQALCSTRTFAKMIFMLICSAIPCYPPNVLNVANQQKRSGTGILSQQVTMSGAMMELGYIEHPNVGNETGFTFPAFSSRTFPGEFPRKIQVCFEAWNIWNSPVHLSMKSIHATTCACWGPWYLDQFALASVTLVMFHPRLGEAAGLDLSFWSLSIHS